MKIVFNRRKIETICIVLAFLLVVLITFLGILAVADEMFSWDILPENIEKVMVVMMSSIGMVIGATFLISMMINFSLVSMSLEKFANNFEKYVDKKEDE